MNEEVKQTIDMLDFISKQESATIKITQYGCKILIDYITNLQEELKSANESITWWQNRFNALQEERKTLYRYTPEKGFELVGDEDVKDKR